MARTVSIIIPIYNEAATIEQLFARVVGQEISDYSKEIILVESNSTDGSRELVKKIVESAKAPSGMQNPFRVSAVFQNQPMGKGNAVRAGMESATGDIILIQDADLEYDTADYPALLEPIRSGKAQFVLGSRHLSAGNWKIRKFENDPFRSIVLNFGGIFFHGLFNLVFQVKLSDPTTMFKVFSRSCIANLSLTRDRFDFDYELAGKLIRAGFVPYEVPVSYKSRGFSEGKKIRIFRDPINWVIGILYARFSKLYRKSTKGVTPGLSVDPLVDQGTGRD